MLVDDSSRASFSFLEQFLSLLALSCNIELWLKCYKNCSLLGVVVLIHGV
jgi:hypothetical protein